MSHYPSRWLTRTSDPLLEPVSVTDAKLFLRIDAEAEDALIGDLIKTTRILAEEVTAKALITQSWSVQYEQDIPQHIPLPYTPIQDVLSVSWYDEDETLLGTLDASAYHLNARKDTLILESAPTGPLLRVSYRCGYGDAANDVPHPIRHAMLIHIAALYEQRDSLTPPAASLSLYHCYREVRL